MKITFLSQRQLATLVMFVLSGLLEFLLMKLVSPELSKGVFILSAIVLFYFSIEVSQNYITDPIVLDFRSQEVKELEEKNRATNLIEGMRYNLLMRVAQNELKVEDAEKIYFTIKRFEENTNPLLLAEAEDKRLEEEFNQRLKIGQYASNS